MDNKQVVDHLLAQLKGRRAAPIKPFRPSLQLKTQSPSSERWPASATACPGLPLLQPALACLCHSLQPAPPPLPITFPRPWQPGSCPSICPARATAHNSSSSRPSHSTQLQ